MEVRGRKQKGIAGKGKIKKSDATNVCIFSLSFNKLENQCNRYIKYFVINSGNPWVFREFREVLLAANVCVCWGVGGGFPKKKKMRGVINNPQMLPSYNSKPASWEVLSSL